MIRKRVFHFNNDRYGKTAWMYCMCVLYVCVCACMSQMSKVKSIIGCDSGAKLGRSVLVVTVTTACL